MYFNKNACLVSRRTQMSSQRKGVHVALSGGTPLRTGDTQTISLGGEWLCPVVNLVTVQVPNAGCLVLGTTSLGQTEIT